MSVLIADDSPYGMEIWKWEHHEGEGHPKNSSIRGMRPQYPRAYPAMMYHVTNKNPWRFDSQIAKDEAEQRNLESCGFVAGGPAKAAEAYDNQVQEAARMAAARNYEDRNMSEKARAHSEAVEMTSSQHLGEIPETPIAATNKKR